MNNKLDFALHQSLAKAIRQRKRVPRKIPVMLHPSGAVTTYRAAWLRYIRDSRKRISDLLDQYLPMIYRARQQELGLHTDSWADDVESLHKRVVEEMTVEIPLLASAASKSATRAIAMQAGQWDKVKQAVLGIPLFQSDPGIRTEIQGFVQRNTELIKQVAADTSGQINTIVSSGMAAGKRVETIKKEILAGTDLQKGVFKKVETRAALIARDQIAKTTGNVTRMRQQALGLEYYTWRTSMDERVRKDHAVMEGLLCRWDDATVCSRDGGKTWVARPAGAVELHPGEDYQCRCYAEPWFDSLFEQVTPAEEPTPAVAAPAPVVTPVPAATAPTPPKEVKKPKAVRAPKPIKAVSEETTRGTAEQMEKRKYKDIWVDGFDDKNYIKFNARHNNQLDSWTPEQMSIVRKYTAEDYSLYNSVARGDRGRWKGHAGALKRADKSIKILEEALDKSVVGEDIVSYRYFSKWKDMPDWNKMVGKEYVDAGFSSTSIKKDTGNFGWKTYHMKISVPKETKGAYVNSLSKFKNKELELLLQKNTSYYIKSVKQVGDKVHIEAIAMNGVK